MDTLQLMLLSLMIGASVSQGNVAVVGDAPKETVAIVQQGAQASLGAQETQKIIYVTPAPTSQPDSAASGEYTRQLYRGCQGEDVRAVQQLLLDLKYKVTVDGTYGSQTKNAVIAFQRNNGLKGDGIVGARTYRKLTSSTAKPAGSQSTERTSLSYGMSGDDVRVLQTRLADLNYYSDKVSGNFLTNTKYAVRAFQKANGLTVDGIAGPSTLSALYSSSAIAAAGSSSQTGSSNASRTLSHGMSGSDVKKLQTQLKALGYFSGNVTDYFGDATERAVLLFQKANGLMADGIAGSATISALFGAGAIANGGTSATAKPSGVGNKCAYCGEKILEGMLPLHTTVARCGAHYTCEKGAHNDILGNCGHYKCQDVAGRSHALLECGEHYACNVGSDADHLEANKCDVCGGFKCRGNHLFCGDCGKRWCDPSTTHPTCRK